MPAAVVRSTGVMRQLDRRAGATQQLTADDVTDAQRLAREVNELRGKAAEQDRRHDPMWIDFEDVAVDATATTKYRLPHKFGGRVRWWVVDWTPAVTGDVAAIGKHADTDSNTLVLVSGNAGTATIRVEKAG